MLQVTEVTQSLPSSLQHSTGLYGMLYFCLLFDPALANPHSVSKTPEKKFFVLLFFLLDGLQKRFDSLSSSVSERAEQLQTALAQSVSVQEGLKCLLSWLNNLQTKPGPVEATAYAVQDALTQNQVGFTKKQCCSVFFKTNLSMSDTHCGYVASPLFNKEDLIHFKKH